MTATATQRSDVDRSAISEPSASIGIVGTGFMGHVHARAALAAGASVRVAGATRSDAVDLAGKLPGVTVADDLTALLASDVDVVHICAPNSEHAWMAEAVIGAGKHVVCEKPLATSAHDAQTLQRKAEDAGLVTGVPFVYRYYPTLLAARDRIARHPENHLWLLHGSYLQDWLADDQTTNWRVDAGAGGSSRAFGDIGVHWCDLMEFVTGQRIVRLICRFGQAFSHRGPSIDRRPVATEDGGVLIFETDRGATGSVVVSQASAGHSNQLTFNFDGPQESYGFDQEHPNELWLGQRDGRRELVRDPGRMERAGIGLFPLPAGHPEGYGRNFENFVRDVVTAIGGGTPVCLPTFADGTRASRITAAAVTSATTNEWVDVAS